MDAYRSDLTSARRRIDELEAALQEAQAEIERLKAPPPMRPDRPLERKLGFSLGIGAMLLTALGVQLSQPSERSGAVVAASYPKLVVPALPPPALPVGTLDIEPAPPRPLRPEDVRQLADPVAQPKLIALDTDETQEAIYDESSAIELSEPGDAALDAHARYLLGSEAYQAGQYKTAIEHLLEAVSDAGSPAPEPVWLSHAYGLIARSARHLNLHGLAAIANRQAEALSGR